MVETLKERIQTIHRTVSGRFIEKSDRGEDWQMPPSDYDGSQIIRDDCDGFCLAVRTLLRQRYIPSRLVYCEVEGVGHLVVEVQGWILDNRQPVVMANTLLKARGYRFKRISGYLPGEPWHEIIFN